MRNPPSKTDLFKGRHFEQEIIILRVRWYLRYKLSYRDLVEMMAERGLPIAHTTILRWVQRYAPEFDKRWSRFSAQAGLRGEPMRRTLRSAADGLISIACSIPQAGPSTFGSAHDAMSPRPGLFFARP